MDWSRHCAAIIPCLNEANTIQSVTSAVRRYLPTVIVIDDGSSDETERIASAAGATVIRNDSPQGKGAALAQGIQRISQDGFPWGLMLDGDGQHDPSDIPAFFERAEESSVAMVVGNRMSFSAGMPWTRRLVNRWMSRTLSRLCNRSLPDTQCGFRLFRVPIWLSLNLQTRHFECESESLYLLIAARYEISFVPIRTVYRAEKSKIRPLRDSIRWLRWYWRVRETQRTASLAPRTSPATF